MRIEVTGNDGAKWLKWAKNQLHRLAQLRADLDLPKLVRRLQPASGVSVLLQSTEFGSFIRITATSGELMFAHTLDGSSFATYIAGTSGATMSVSNEHDSGAFFSHYTWSKDGNVLAWLVETTSTLHVVRFDGQLDAPQQVDDVAHDAIQTYTQYPVPSAYGSPQIVMDAAGARIVVASEAAGEAFVTLDWVAPVSPATQGSYTETRHELPVATIEAHAGRIGDFNSSTFAASIELEYNNPSTDDLGDLVLTDTWTFPDGLVAAKFVDHLSPDYAYAVVRYVVPTGYVEHASTMQTVSESGFPDVYFHHGHAFTFDLTWSSVVFQLNLATGAWSEWDRVDHDARVTMVVHDKDSTLYSRELETYCQSTGGGLGDIINPLGVDFRAKLAAGTEPNRVTFNFVEPYHDSEGIARKVESITHSTSTEAAPTTHVLVDKLDNWEGAGSTGDVAEYIEIDHYTGLEQPTDVVDDDLASVEMDTLALTDITYTGFSQGQQLVRPLHIGAESRVLMRELENDNLAYVYESPDGYLQAEVDDTMFVSPSADKAFHLVDADATLAVIDSAGDPLTDPVACDGLIAPVFDSEDQVVANLPGDEASFVGVVAYTASVTEDPGTLAATAVRLPSETTETATLNGARLARSVAQS